MPANLKTGRLNSRPDTTERTMLFTLAKSKFPYLIWHMPTPSHPECGDIAWEQFL